MQFLFCSLAELTKGHTFLKPAHADTSLPVHTFSTHERHQRIVNAARRTVKIRVRRNVRHAVFDHRQNACCLR